MLSFVVQSPERLLTQIAARIKSLRLERGWSRLELSERAGIALPTLRKFEDTGHISLERLLRLALALGIINEFENLITDKRVVKSLAELENRNAARTRKRGRTSKKENK